MPQTITPHSTTIPPNFEVPVEEAEASSKRSSLEERRKSTSSPVKLSEDRLEITNETGSGLIPNPDNSSAEVITHTAANIKLPSQEMAEYDAHIDYAYRHGTMKREPYYSTKHVINIEKEIIRIREDRARKMKDFPDQLKHAEEAVQNVFSRFQHFLRKRQRNTNTLNPELVLKQDEHGSFSQGLPYHKIIESGKSNKAIHFALGEFVWNVGEKQQILDLLDEAHAITIDHSISEKLPAFVDLQTVFETLHGPLGFILQHERAYESIATLGDKKDILPFWRRAVEAQRDFEQNQNYETWSALNHSWRDDYIAGVTSNDLAWIGKAAFKLENQKRTTEGYIKRFQKVLPLSEEERQKIVDDLTSESIKEQRQKEKAKAKKARAREKKADTRSIAQQKGHAAESQDSTADSPAIKVEQAASQAANESIDPFDEEIWGSFSLVPSRRSKNNQVLTLSNKNIAHIVDPWGHLLERMDERNIDMSQVEEALNAPLVYGEMYPKQVGSVKERRWISWKPVDGMDKIKIENEEENSREGLAVIHRQSRNYVTQETSTTFACSKQRALQYIDPMNQFVLLIESVSRAIGENLFVKNGNKMETEINRHIDGMHFEFSKRRGDDWRVKQAIKQVCNIDENPNKDPFVMFMPWASSEFESKIEEINQREDAFAPIYLIKIHKQFEDLLKGELSDQLFARAFNIAQTSA